MSSDVVEQIKDRLSIVDVVSSYVKLEKAGKNLLAKSPFSNERTPSFYVSPERGMYYCFSTNQGGDIFTFVEKMEGVDFKGALKILAERAGVKLLRESKAQTDHKDRLYALLESATVFFEKTLASEEDARNYLKERGITETSRKRFRIGYAPASFDSLSHALIAQGYTQKEMLDAGMIKPREVGHGTYDRFRGRLMFPLFDTSGRVVAFSGRIFPHKSNTEFREDIAKYINSPETELYRKSRMLYGYSIAKNHIRKFNCSMLVEGQMDLVLSHQAGYANTVAVSGTALSDDQLILLERLSKNVILAFDADRAGITSGEKGITRALTRGMDVKVVALPPGKDPADIVRESPQAWKALVRDAKHVIDFFLDHLALTHSDPRKLRIAVSTTVIPFLAHIQNRIDRAHFVSRIAERLRIAEEPVWEELRRFRPPERTFTEPARGVERHATEVAHSRKDALLKHLVEMLMVEEAESPRKREVDVKVLIRTLEHMVGKETLAGLRASLREEENRILFAYEGKESKGRAQEVEELLAYLKREIIQEALFVVSGSLRAAEAAGNKKTIEELSREHRRLTAELKGT
jgi:DNA primase